MPSKKPTTLSKPSVPKMPLTKLLKKTAPKPALKHYDPATDRTLTRTQGKVAAFRQIATQTAVSRKRIAPAEFRFPSNATTVGHASGYHEFIPTDLVVHLSQRTAVGSGGQSQLPSMPGFLSKYSKALVREDLTQTLLGFADGARSDTAREVMSGPRGSAAGHSGSGVSLENQGPAHDLLRRRTLKILRDFDTNMTPHAAAVAAAAMAVFSHAPGELANQAKGIGSLKDKSAMPIWEDLRTESKARVFHLFTQLSKGEQQRVNLHMQKFLKSAAKGAAPSSVGGARQLEPSRPTTPPRQRKHTGAVQGGGYDWTQSIASIAPQATHSIKLSTPTAIGLYVTAPLRADRQ